jgi:hypothetical protein
MRPFEDFHLAVDVRATEFSGAMADIASKRQKN